MNQTLPKGDFMHIYGLLILALQISCAVHAIKTGRTYGWVFVILFFPVVGCLVYVIVEVIPDLRHGGRRVASTLVKVIDPEVDLKRRAADLAISGSVDNKARLAEECIAHGRFHEASELYRSCLRGVHKDDPHIMLGLARALFLSESYAEAKDTLDRLIEANPDFKSPEGHLIFARSLEQLNQTEVALEEYRVLAGYYPGLEATCRYALLLRRVGRGAEADALFNEIVIGAKKFQQHYKKDQRQWVEIARAQLAKSAG